MIENVFLTGATGALGPILAAELLSSGVAGRLRVLIRPDDAPAHIRFDRWIQTLESVLVASGSLLAHPRTRVALAEGDLRAEGLDLTESCRKEITDEAQVIIHGAADTNFRGNGNAHRETNVEGTRRVLELASNCRRLKKIIYISTICASGIQAGLIREEAVTREPNFANAYERTKWEAEQLALASGLPVEVVRVGVVMGSSITGAVYRMGALHHGLRWFGNGQMEVVPGRPNTPVDLIDAEMPAKLIRKLAAAPVQSGAIYHASSGRRAAPLQDVCRFLAMQMHESPCDDEPWTLDHHAPHSPQLARLARSCLPVLLANRTYDTTRAEQLWGGPLPLADWRTTLAKVLAFCGFTDRQSVSVG